MWYVCLNKTLKALARLYSLSLNFTSFVTKLILGPGLPQELFVFVQETSNS